MARDLTDLNGQDKTRTSADARERADHSDYLSSRTIELDDPEEAQFLRAEKRVAVRRSPLDKKTRAWLKRFLVIGAFVVSGGGAAWATYQYGTHSWRFRLDSSANIEISGEHNASRAQVMDIFGIDIGRNIFAIPLDAQKNQLEQISWVESATVMRLLPNRLAIEIRERTPVAFARIGSRVSLIDSSGVVLGLAAHRQAKYSFPVIEGITEAEPLSSRAAAMRIYNRLVFELDAEGSHYSQDLSEVDLSDPEDIKVIANGAGGAVLVHLGNSEFLPRYKLYLSHITEWRQQHPKLQSVDLRYEGWIYVSPNVTSEANGEREQPRPGGAVIKAGNQKPAQSKGQPKGHRAQ